MADKTTPKPELPPTGNGPAEPVPEFPDFGEDPAGPHNAGGRLASRVLFLLGCLLFLVAFISAGAETAVHVKADSRLTLLSAHDLWYRLDPDGFLLFQFQIKKHVGQLLWDPVLVAVLSLPAWLILGVPGAALVWFCRSPREAGGGPDEEALYLYDRLAAAAREEGYDDDPPDNLSHVEEAELELDSAGATTIHDAKEFADEWEQPDYSEAGIPKGPS